MGDLDWLFGGTQQVNPYTNSWMSNVGNEQNMLKSMLFGGAGGAGGGLLDKYMGFDTGSFMKNFLGSVPALQGLTRTASDAEIARASALGKQGQDSAAANFSGLGSLYSGANLLAGNKAYQDSMGDLSGKIASENFSLLNNLYGNSMNSFLGAQGQGLNAMGSGIQNLFGLYGQNANNVAGASSPIFQNQPGLLSQLGGLLGGAGAMAGGLGSLLPLLGGAAGAAGAGGAMGGISSVAPLFGAMPFLL
jgi:trimeric autotransporter adhesin